jgi:hypothetical protein
LRIALTLRVRRYLAVLALLFCFSPAALSQGAPLDLDQYTSQLDQYEQAIQDSATNPASLRSLHASLPPRWLVNARGQQFAVSTDWLSESLGRIEQGGNRNRDVAAQTAQKLQLMKESARELATQDSAANSGAIHSQLDAILNSREFRDTAPRPPTAWDRLRARIQRWWNRLLDRIFSRLHLGTTSRSAIAWTVIAAVALLLLFWAVRYTLGGSDSTGIDFSGAGIAGLDWHQWLGRAREAAERGDYRQAVHAAYWTGVTRLEETKLVPQDESQTPREILRLLRREQSEYAPLARLTTNFELVWYGHRDATVAEWQDALQQLDRIGCPLPLTLKTAT